MVDWEPLDERTRLRWNTRYEHAKPSLLRRLVALTRASAPGDFESAGRLIAAVGLLPEVGESGGRLTVENRVAQDVGDSDFIYSLHLGEDGFELSHFERMLIGGGQRDYTPTVTLVRCTSDDFDDEDEDADTAELEGLREMTEMMAGHTFDDDEWRAQVEAASGSSDVDIPNGIETWLEMLPVADDGDPPETVIVRWE